MTDPLLETAEFDPADDGKGDELELEISGYGYEGKGISKVHKKIIKPIKASVKLQLVKRS